MTQGILKRIDEIGVKLGIQKWMSNYIQHF